jgi:hypothetical protein
MANIYNATSFETNLAEGFFTSTQREAVIFCMEDFSSMVEFRGAIADQVRTLAAQNLELRFQHKSRKINGIWTIDLDELRPFCAKYGCEVRDYGRASNNYQWRIVPRATVLGSGPQFV